MKIITVFILGATLVFTSCSSEKAEVLAGEIATTQMSITGTPEILSIEEAKATAVSYNQKDFIKDASGFFMLDAILSNYADQHATHTIKKMAKSVFDSNKEASMLLRSIAEKAGVRAGTELSDEHRKFLNALKGKRKAAFDAVYKSTIQDILSARTDLYQKALEQDLSPELEDFASEHLKKLKNLQKRVIVSTR